MGHFDEDAPTVVHIDASNVGLGAVLAQWQDGAEKVIAYASRSLSRTEEIYSTIEKSVLRWFWAVNKFRPYLYGRSLDVFSDHHSLCWLTNLKDPSGRLARWSLKLEEFDMAIVYKSGKRHADADCLSPFEPASAEDDYATAFVAVVNMTTLAQQQRADPELECIIGFVEGRTSTLAKRFGRGLPSFCLGNDVFYKVDFSANGSPYLLVVPPSLRNEILQACHDEATSGHLGFTRTLCRVRQRYYCPRLTATVQQYARTCRDCQWWKVPAVKSAGLLHPIEVPTTPFAQVGMDLLGPIPTSATGHRWIIVATDYLTRYA